MHFTIPQPALAAALSQLARVAATRTSLPILAHVLVATEERDGIPGVRLAATNLEVGLTRWLPCAVAAPGACTIPAHLLADLVGALPDQPITIELAAPETQGKRKQPARPTRATIRAGRAHAALSILQADDYPGLPGHSRNTGAVEGAVPLATVRASALKEAIGSVAPAAARDESRPVLAGIELRATPGHLALSAADGFRLAHRVLDLPGATEARKAIVPARALVELARQLPADNTDIALALARSAIVCQLPPVDDTVGAGEFSSRVIEGSFPDAGALLAETHATRVVVERAAAIAALKLALPFAPEHNSALRLRVAPGFMSGESERSEAEDGGTPTGSPGTLTLATGNEGMGDNNTDLDAVVTGPPQTIGMNGRYLLDALGSIKADRVVIEIVSPNQGAAFRPDGDDPTPVHLIMPCVIPDIAK